MEKIDRIIDCSCFFGCNSMSPDLSVSEENIIEYYKDIFKILEKYAFPVLISLDELDITGN